MALTASEATRFGVQPVTAGSPSTGLGTGANATLDLCAASFASETLRVERYQVNFVSADGQNQVAEINEIARYRAGGAARAYSEIVAVARRCHAMSRNGVRVSKPTIEPRSATLVSHQLTVAFSQTQAGQTVYSANVYQYQGDWFDGIYVTRGSQTDALTAARSLAAAAAGKLRRAAA